MRTLVYCRCRRGPSHFQLQLIKQYQPRKTTTITCHMLELPHAKKMLLACTHTHTHTDVHVHEGAAICCGLAHFFLVPCSLCFFVVVVIVVVFGVKNLWFKDTQKSNSTNFHSSFCWFHFLATLNSICIHITCVCECLCVCVCVFCQVDVCNCQLVQLLFVAFHVKFK